MEEDKNKKKKFITRLKESLNRQYDIVFYRLNNYELIWSKQVRKLTIVSYALIFLLVYTAFIMILIIFTPLNRVLPAYHDSELQQKVVQNAIRADSLEHELRIRDQYINNIRKVLQGKSPDNEVFTQDSAFIDNKADTNSYNQMSSKNQAERNNKNRVFRETSPNEIPVSALDFISPIEGMIVDTFNVNKKHYGVDLVSEPDEPILSVLEGTVISASWTLTTGYVIRIQHKNNLISSYKHNSVLMKETGDYVSTGEPIAIIGNTGQYTTGPHLHFELWKDGVPVDPENYINF